jgi:hypothetical protein
MPQHNGSFGSISYNNNDTTITIEIDPAALGDLALTSPDGRIECYWNGTEWVCNSILFASGNPNPAQTQAKAAKKE